MIRPVTDPNTSSTMLFTENGRVTMRPSTTSEATKNAIRYRKR
jgi:hypothetical protein